MPNFVDDRGVIYIVYGLRAKDEAEQSIRALRAHCPWPITAIGDHKPKGATHHIPVGRVPGGAPVSARAVKVNLYAYSPYAHTLYLDADTRPKESLDAGWAALEAGWDLAIAPSWDPGFSLLGTDERGRLILTLGARYPLPLNSGVMFFGRSDRNAQFWRAWAEEWRRYRGQDQGALLLALQRAKPRVLVLGRQWNIRHTAKDAIIEHYFGRSAE
jgi:hypothetical protein